MTDEPKVPKFVYLASIRNPSRKPFLRSENSTTSPSLRDSQRIAITPQGDFSARMFCKHRERLAPSPATRGERESIHRSLDVRRRHEVEIDSLAPAGRGPASIEMVLFEGFQCDHVCGAG